MVGYAVASFAFGLIYMGPLPRIWLKNTTKIVTIYFMKNFL
jgi:hypothetical protein